MLCNTSVPITFGDEALRPWDWQDAKWDPFILVGVWISEQAQKSSKANIELIWTWMDFHVFFPADFQSHLIPVQPGPRLGDQLKKLKAPSLRSPTTSHEVGLCGFYCVHQL